MENCEYSDQRAPLRALGSGYSLFSCLNAEVLSAKYVMTPGALILNMVENHI